MTRQSGVRIRGGAAALLFSASALLGLVLFAVLVVSDLEGATFDPAIRGGATLRRLDCPALLSESEIAVVRASFDNPLERPLQYLVRVHVSQGYVTLFREIDYQLPLDPGERQLVRWEVSADDAAYGWLVLVKVFQSGSYPLPSRSGSCGIPVVPVPFLTGDQFFALLFAASVLGMGMGIALWKRAGRSAGTERNDVSNAMFALGAALLAGIVVGTTGAWLPGVVILAGTLLLTMGLMFYFVFKVE